MKDLFYGFRKEAHPLKYISLSLVAAAIPILISLLPEGGILIYRLLAHSKFRTYNNIVISIRVLKAILSVTATVLLAFSTSIMVDQPETGIADALKGSISMMKSRFFRGCWLYTLSFLLWEIVMVICRLTSFFIRPYIEMTKMVFYLDADGSSWQVPGAKRKYKKKPAAESGTAEPAADSSMEEPGAENSTAEPAVENDMTAEAAECSVEEPKYAESEPAEQAATAQTDTVQVDTAQADTVQEHNEEFIPESGDPECANIETGETGEE